MSERIKGRRGELLRMGLGARNWILAHLDDNPDVMAWKISESARSPEDIVEHVAWTVSAVSSAIAEELKLDLNIDDITDSSTENSLASDVKGAYILFRRLCEAMSDEMLDIVTTLPPPARIREDTVEIILRIIAGYHTAHHAGQVAMLVKIAKKKL